MVTRRRVDKKGSTANLIAECRMRLPAGQAGNVASKVL